MKYIKSFLLIICLTLAGCSSFINDSPSEHSVSKETGRTIKIVCRPEINGAPVSSGSSDSIRSASATLPDGYTFYGSLDSGAKYPAEKQSDGTYFFTFPEYTSKMGSSVYFSVSLYRNGEDVTVKLPVASYTASFDVNEDEYEINAGTVVLRYDSAKCRTDEKGGVALYLKLPDSDCSLSVDAAGFSASASSGIGYIEGTQVSPGEMQLTLTVKRNSKPVLVCTQTVTVFPEMTTDFWTTGSVTSGTYEGNSVSCLDVSSMQYTTFYVRSSQANKWYYSYDELSSCLGSDETGDGSVLKPFATIQKAVDHVLSLNSGNTDYTIYVDGTFTAASSSSALVNFSNLSKKLENLTIEGLGTQKAVLQGGGMGLHSGGYGTARLTNDSEYTDNCKGVIALSGSAGSPLAYDANLTLKNLLIQNGGGVQYGSNQRTGGGIDVSGTSGSVVVLDNVQVTECNGWDGGAVRVAQSQMVLTNGSIIGKIIDGKVTKDNCANYSRGKGAGVSLYKGGRLTVKNGCYVTGNYLDSESNSGGGIYISNDSNAPVSTLVLEDGAAVENNYSGKFGGGIYLEGYSRVSFKGNAGITKNEAKAGGSGIYGNALAAMTYNDANIQSGMEPVLDLICGNYGDDVINRQWKYIRLNEASEDAAANSSNLNRALLNLAEMSNELNILGQPPSDVYLVLGKTTDESLTFTINECLKLQGGKNGVNITIQPAFYNDADNKDKRVIFDGQETFTIMTTTTDTLNGNWSFEGLKFYKGNYAVYLYEASGLIKFTNCDFDSCVDNALIATLSNVNIIGGSFVNNKTTSSNGGAINIWAGGTVNLSGGVVIEENSAFYGGGIYIGDGCTLELFDGTIRNNTARREGAGIYQDGTLKLGANALIDTDNDIYLPSGKFIRLEEDLTASVAAKIKPESYAESTPILDGLVVRICNNYDKFEVTQDSAGNDWGINSDGFLVKRYLAVSSLSDMSKFAEIRPTKLDFNVNLTNIPVTLDVGWDMEINGNNKTVSFAGGGYGN